MRSKTDSVRPAIAEERGEVLITPRAVAEMIQNINAEIRDLCVRRARLQKAHLAASLDNLTIDQFERLI